MNFSKEIFPYLFLPLVLLHFILSAPKHSVIGDSLLLWPLRLERVRSVEKAASLRFAA